MGWVHSRAMRRGHFIILVGGAIVLFVLLIFAEVLSLVESEPAVPDVAAIPDLGVVRSKTVRIPAQRGDIRDREGRVLASTEREQRLRIFLDDLLGHYGVSLGKSVPVNRYFVGSEGGREMVLEDDVFAVAHEVLVVPLREHGMELRLRAESIQEHFRLRKGEAFFVEIEREGSAQRSEEFDLAEWVGSIDGVILEEFGKRVYGEGAMTGSAVGLIDLATGKGVRGAEMNWNEVLEGKPGEVVLEFEGTGEHEVSHEKSREDPVRGMDIELALDLDFQREVWEAMESVETGVAVVLNARSGEVLVQLSKPEFDPNEVLSTGSGQGAVLPLDESGQVRGILGLSGVLEGLLMPVSGVGGAEEGLLDGEAGFALEESEDETGGGDTGELLGVLGMEMEEGEVLRATPMELALLGAAIVNGGVVLEPQTSLVAAEGARETGGLAEGGVGGEALTRLVEVLGTKDEAGAATTVWLAGAIDFRGDEKEGRWVVFATTGAGPRLCGCVLDVGGTSLSLEGIGRRILKRAME
jgi:cell division protein FtsI/penicillin-binding protein 2